MTVVIAHSVGALHFIQFFHNEMVALAHHGMSDGLKRDRNLALTPPIPVPPIPVHFTAKGGSGQSPLN